RRARPAPAPRRAARRRPRHLAIPAMSGAWHRPGPRGPCPGARHRDMSALARASALASLTERQAGRAAEWIELDRPHELPRSRGVVAEHLLVEAAELVPPGRVQRLEL